ncbi:MAG TPA: sodium:alanine symporter family protein [Desulfobacteraceae bacterium]|nr:sodium:alanine symporter family protein [Desulfobacteraceae bacterium]
MDAIMSVINAISGFVWGPVMLILLVGTGIFLTFGTKWKTVTKLGYAIKLLFQGRKKADQKGEGEITPFQALMTALSATIGTGNIAGVATAIFLGGPGAVFWMWVTALFGMATKYGEAVLAVKYREVMPDGSFVGGPMYYIKNGMGKNWKWLGFLFALFAAIAAFGIGNMVQSNSVARAVERAFSVPYWVTGLVLAGMTFAVVIGGIKRIAEVTEKLVPLMAAVYVIGALIIIIANIDKLGSAFGLIFSDAFTGTAAAGGFAGSAVAQAMRFGVARGVFSNEAGLGSAPIAHAAARTQDPVRQGIVAGLSPFIDTILVCTLTALLIIMTGAWTSGETGAELSQMAFNMGMPGLGDFVVGFGLIIFAFSTMLAWCYYGQVSFEYLFGLKGVTPYRILYVIFIFIGAIVKLDFVWTFSDMMNGLMIVPNLIALLVLSPVIFKITREYFDKN